MADRRTQHASLVGVDILGDLVFADVSCYSGLYHRHPRAASDENDRVDVVLHAGKNTVVSSVEREKAVTRSVTLTMVNLASARASSIGAVNRSM